MVSPEFQKAVDYLCSLVDYEKKTTYTYNAKTFNLQHFSSFLEQFNNPQRKFKSILVAGTKGKGSTAIMIASVLHSAGFKTGLFTSPHLISFRERIRVNDRWISEKELVRFLEEIKPYIKQKKSEDFRTVFEILTTIAFLYFAKRAVDYAVLEVGLGGRLDATNVVNPEISVITSISYDHTDKLGNTLSQIAFEKCGIIRKKGIVISAPQEKEALAVIQTECRKKSASLFLVGRDVSCQIEKVDLKGTHFHFNGVFGKEKNLFISLLGEYQVENAACAFGALKSLQIEGEDIRRGFTKVVWPGRLQILGRKPYLVLDGAHNVESIVALKNSIKKLFSYQRLFLILGVSQDKDLKGMLRAINKEAYLVIATKANHPRGLEPEVIFSEAKKLGAKAIVCSAPQSAVSLALSCAEKGDLILVTGSLYLVGEVLAQFCH
ncbi:MAG: folylpolyglutamate synthase/dihydrofolate synthase family protein [Candidatus Edwardsbacteria bacterium]